MSADLALTTVKEKQKLLGKLEKNITEKQNLLEKKKLEYDDMIVKKEQFIANVSY